MHAELRKLLIVQEMDREIHKLRDELVRYPDLRKARSKEIEREREKMDAARNQARDLEKKIRDSDLEVRRLRETLGKLLATQSKVKNQKEYDALTLEMQQTEQKILEIDEKGLDALSQQERMNERLAAMEPHMVACEEEYQQEVGRLNAREEEKTQLLQDYTRRRNHDASQIDQNVMHRYQRLATLFPGNCLVTVKEGNCAGCFMRVLPRRMQDLTRDDAVNECDSCHRFLYLPEK